jgi:3-deoxy-D-manno-octulosonic-acid transferase
MNRAVRDADPEIVILVETEIWPGFLAALKKSRARTMVVNGRINEKYLKRYRLWPSFWKALAPDLVLAISPADARRFEKLFGGKVEVMPNMKFDRVPPAPAATEQNPVAGLLAPQTPFLVLGSVRQEEEGMIAKLITRIRQQLPEVVIGLFPRHMHRIEQWKSIMSRAGGWQLRSAAKPAIAAGTVLLWDTFGELSLAYQSATAAFVGGSLAPLGGQNFLEPLVCGVPPVIGPSWENFTWIGSEIIGQALVRVASDWETAADLLLQDLKSPPPRDTVQKAALTYIQERQGGTARVCRLINELLQRQPMA